MIIAIDFDNTIAKTNFPKIIEPIPGALTTIRDLSIYGHKLILWTLREDELLDDALNWLKQKEIYQYFNEINENIYDEIIKWKANPRKIAADYYIDDRAIGWKGWHQVRQFFCLS